ncbi:hypothetical protein R3P38DRAFT_3117484 [Favolaschia claudopus]|uniref:F-box domain-containing protein n=1 Tax=Favolaschia claudopus TaxID=2862362 RepID=A0AAV9ZES3_9AGAR
MEPFLPPELEREIFETAAVRDRRNIPTLLRVSRRVLGWVEPLLYRTLILDDYHHDHALVALRSKTVEFKRQAVRHVILGYYTEQMGAHTFLFGCPGIETLVVDGCPSEELLCIMDTLRIKKLNIRFSSRSTPEWTLSTLSRPLFLSITHLEIYRDYVRASSDPVSWDEEWCPLAALPELTHLCLAYQLAMNILRPTLENCLQLQVLIPMFWHTHSARQAAKFAELELSTSDFRVVVMMMGLEQFNEDWEMGVRGGDDFWHRADSFVARKRRGEIESSVYLLKD